MGMHKIEQKIPLTGSKLFDVVMYNTAQKLCADYPGLSFDYGKTHIYLFGELDDASYEKYQQEVIGQKDKD
jgi:hypothetical protein